jgi:hypothetical protein
MTRKVLLNICLLIALYYFVYFVYTGLLHPIPSLGDDWDYHIPISRSILDGSFLHPPPYTYFARYYPGSAEAINSLLILLHIPLTLSSIFAVAVLFYACFLLGRTFHLDRELSLLYASAFCTLTVILRWANKVSIDVWLTVFFLLGIVLLVKPKPSLRSFFALGITSGMLIGTKYTGLVYLLLLLVVFGRNVLVHLSLKRFLAFCLPFFVFGVFWYLRNYLIVKTPWPVCTTHNCLTMTNTWYLWQELLRVPAGVGNALFGEYKLWAFAPLFALAALVWLRSRSAPLPYGFAPLSILGLACFLFYWMLPTSQASWQTVSTIRYTLPAYATLILSVFLLARQYHQETALGYGVIANMLPVLSMTYYPKLVFIYLPLSFALFALPRHAGMRRFFPAARKRTRQ